MTKQYLRNLSLWLRGIRWLWTRLDKPDGYTLKPGWTPLKFLPVYLTTYLAGTLLGYGVVSLSRAWYDRSQWRCKVCGQVEGSWHDGHKVVWTRSEFARFMTRLLDWAFPGSAHGRHTGPRLWGSVNQREV